MSITVAIIIFLLIMAYQRRQRPEGHDSPHTLRDAHKPGDGQAWRQTVELENAVADVRINPSDAHDYELSVTEVDDSIDPRTYYDPVFDENEKALVAIRANDNAAKIHTRLAGSTRQVVIVADADGITINEVEADGDYEPIFYVSAVELRALTAFPLNQVVRESDDGRAVIYQLRPDEYQINIGPGDDGTVRVFNFTGLPPQGLRASEFVV